MRWTAEIDERNSIFILKLKRSQRLSINVNEANIVVGFAVVVGGGVVIGTFSKEIAAQIRDETKPTSSVDGSSIEIDRENYT